MFCCLSLCIFANFLETHARTMLTIDPVTGRPMIYNDEDPVQVQKMKQHQQQYQQQHQSHHDHAYQDQDQDEQENPEHQKLQQKNLEKNLAAAEPIPPVKSEPDPIVPTHGHELKGCFQVVGGDKKDKVPEYRVYFNGRQTMNNCEGFYSFPIERKEVANFSLVICKGFKHNIEQKNTIKNVSIIPNKDYQYFTYRNNGYNSGSWVRSDQRFNHENFVIPENCVVVLLDPAHVDHVTEWNMQLGERFTKLPVIALKGASNLTDLKHESAKSLLSSLDAKMFHEPITEIKKIAPNNPKIHMSLAQ